MSVNHSSFPRKSAIRATIRNLREIVTAAEAVDRHEAIRLLRQMEVNAVKLERKVRATARKRGKSGSDFALPPASQYPAQIPV